MGQETTEAVITKLTATDIEVKTLFGDVIVLPRFFGEVPKEGTAVMIDMSEGMPKLFLPAPTTTISNADRYMNFLKLDGAAPPPSGPAPTVQIAGKTSNIGPYVPFSFADTPVGARTLIASNGNVVFSGPTAVGMAVSCHGKMIIHDTGQLELVTPHYVAMHGKTIIVSNFAADIHIEIDIIPSQTTTGVDFSALSDSIRSAIAGSDSDQPMTYEEAFLANYMSAPAPAFVKMFGLHLASILVSYRWERLKFRGKQSVFDSIFDGTVASFDGYYGYCNDCFQNNKIAELEFFMFRGNGSGGAVHVTVPTCERQVQGTIFVPEARINNEQYVIHRMHLVTREGVYIEYFVKKRTYANSIGTMADKSFLSAKVHADFLDKLVLDVDSIALANLNFSSANTDMCGNNMTNHGITWHGNFVFSATGSVTIASSTNIRLAATTSTKIIGGTRGILIDSSGSSAITI